MAFHKVQFLEWYCSLIYKYDLQPRATNKSTGEIYDDDTGLWRAIYRENITKSYKSVIILDLQKQNGYQYLKYCLCPVPITSQHHWKAYSFINQQKDTFAKLDYLTPLQQLK